MVTYVENLNVSRCVILSILEMNRYGRYKLVIVVKFSILPQLRISTGNLSQMPCLEQTSAIMILHLSLSSVIRSKAMLFLLFPVTKKLKLSRNVILCLPLLLVPSILPVRDKNSSPLWRHMWPKNFGCLFHIVFMRDLSWFLFSNIDSFVLFSFHDILDILL